MQFRSPQKNNSNKNIEKEFKNLRKELLDLTLRNPLLNFKARNRNLNIINQTPMNAYKTLVLENKKMYFSPNKKESKKSRAHTFIDQTKEFLSSEGDKTLKADLSPSELQKRLFYIDQQAKTMIQEQGYNILYIALGFIEWIDNRKPKQKNLAPLILIPVAMERKKVGNSFSLSWTGEDIQNNISIQAKLREVGIELPKFEQSSYIEGVNQYLEEVRKAIRPFGKWSVKDGVALGFFSFTKFVMYNDLNPESWNENVDLTKNELIQAIFNPSKNVYEDTFEEDDVDEKLHYKTMYQVLDADSSQIAVIENVKAGHNLVVEGPPGTGKSQTIVNLIAELIAEGKTVLFVSEKMAALEVVKSRLDSVGLGKFVLELHSHKTRRKKLLKNLQKATNVRATRDLKLDQTLRKLENLRNQLDEYAEIIHQAIARVNLSPFELYGMKESSEDYFKRNNKILPLVRFNHPEEISMKDLDDIILSLENLAELYGTISKNNPWSYCNPKSLLPGDLREIELLIRDSLDSLNDFRYEMDLVNDLYGIKVPNTLKEYEDSITALGLLTSDSANLVDSSILLNKEWFNNPKRAGELIQLLSAYQNASGLFNKFTDYLLIADLDTIINDLNNDLNKRFKLFGGNSHKDELERLYDGNVPSDREVINDLVKVRQQIKVRQAIKDNEALAERYFGALWSENANINELKALANWMGKFTYLISNGTFNENTVKILTNDLFHQGIDDGIDDYIEKGNRFYETLKKLESKLNPRSKIIFKRETEDVPFDKWELQLNNWKGQLSSLHLWSQYSNTKKSILDTDASIFIKTVEKRNIKKDDVKPLVLGNFADSLLNIVFNENPVLAGFIGELHENRIEEFKDLDRKIINLNRKRIFNKLNSEIPKIFGGAADEEAKVLAGEFTRKSGHLPVRTLLEKAGGAIKKIKPVFMMSPLSIAQYLDPTNPKLQFDVVIFDEASQVKPEDALGAFMRGKTAVVMGDTQQLPPTSFFDQMTDSESGEEVATALDMESILHLCKLSFPVKMLKWHYRSRHESLINISNREFYDNELLVYPSPSHNDSELGLKFHYNPNTAYHRGEGSANPLEAKDVVKEIFRHFEKYGDKKSLGVGTFSVAQKNAILEELEIERKNHPEFEPLFSDKRDERFFVKNLETIQGDERDVILISVGYGFDTEGKMSLNFGPLNQDGGERRLNVLITRAREKCVVFTNFRAHDIHLTANPPFGVKSLQSFLEYAENLQLNQFVAEDDYEEAPFEDSIYNFLIDNGYQVDKHIGCAGFRVDLAIIDEENPGKYLLGIQTDGNNYASSKVARDRDRLREQVLNGLGWNIYHVWSTDWYRNSDLARTRLLEYIESTIVNTKIKDLKNKINDIESMQINPVTTVIIDKKKNLEDEGDLNNSSISDESDMENDSSTHNREDNPEDLDMEDSAVDNDIKRINELKAKQENDEIERIRLSEEELAKEKEKEDLISRYLEGFEEEFTENSDSNEDLENNANNLDSNEYLDEDYIVDEDYSVDEDSIEDLADDYVDDEDSIEDLVDDYSVDEDSIEDLAEDVVDNENNLEDFNISNDNDDGDLDDLANINNSKTSNKAEHKIKENKNSNSDNNAKSINDKNKVSEKASANKSLNENNKKSDKKSVKDSSSKSINENNRKSNKDSNNKSNSRPKSLFSKLKNIGDGFIYGSSDEDIINVEYEEKEKQSYPNSFPEDEFKESNNINNSSDVSVGEEDSMGNGESYSEGDFEEASVIGDEFYSEEEYYYESEYIDSDDFISESEYIGLEDDIIDVNKKETLINDESITNNNDAYYSDLNEIDSEEEIIDEENENMRQKDVSRKREIMESYDDSADYIVPISAEKRQKEEEYGEDADYIVPISEDEDEIISNDNNQEFSNEEINNDYINEYPEESEKRIYKKPNKKPQDESGEVYAQDYNSENPNSNVENDSQVSSNAEDPYFYTATGIENALKKNAVNYQRTDDRNKTGLVGAVSSIKNEMKYINASLKEIENPTESERVYVIDRSAPDEYYEDSYDSTEYESPIVPESQERVSYAEDRQVSNYNNSDDDFESMFTSKKHEYLDKISEYSNENEVYPENTGIYEDESAKYNDNYSNEFSAEISSGDEFEPIIPLNSENTNQNIDYQPGLRDYSQETQDNLDTTLDFDDGVSLNEDELIDNEFADDEFEIDDDEFENIISNVDHDYQEIENERIKEANVLSSVDNTKLTPVGKLEDYITDYEEIEDIIIKNSSEIYDDEKKLATAVMDIVVSEGPIHTDIVIRRIRESCNLSRAGTKFKDAIYKAIDRNESNYNLIRENDFLFRDYDQIKVRKRVKPNIDLISDLEIEKAIDLVLRFEKSLKVNELAKMVSRTFGFRSTSKKTSNRIISVIDIMIGKEILINNNGKIEFL
ncbi:DUF3320 domain-containing protein [uncultured Methanobrevibacter sp.]|uniref:DUF3320 domain-containing protein n=1 Tax=uncultured Methanobrevibacter sp. TaxID=253161 RepID=UPI0026302955